MEVRNEENPSAPPASSKQLRPAPASVDSAAVSQRLQKELMSLMMSGNLGVSAFPESENIFLWIGTIDGGKGTPYEGLSYKLSLLFPLDYPFKPPQVKFETSCFHPNVDQYGNICLDILQDMWSSAYDCRTVLLSIQSLLGEPNNDSPLNSYAAALWSNKEAYKRMVNKQYMEGAEQLERVAILLLIFNIATKAQGQAAPAPAAAPAPGPPPPLNVTAVLEKGGQFRTLIRILQSTQLDERIRGQLNNSNAGLTLFAPSDNAFSSLSPGTLNTLTNQQQVTLLEYHIIPTLITLSEFQTVSNPLSTQAGDSSPGQYPLNVTTAGNQVNISTGLINTTISGTVYSDSQLAVYQVDKVLLPLGVFRPSVPPPPPKAKNASDSTEGPSSSASKDDTSSTIEWRPSRLGLPFVLAVSIFYWSF